MAGAANNKGKQKPFKRGTASVPSPVTVPYGKPSVMLKNIKDQAAQSKGSPKKAETITYNPKKPFAQQIENIRKWGASKPTEGDNPWGKQGP